MVEQKEKEYTIRIKTKKEIDLIKLDSMIKKLSKDCRIVGFQEYEALRFPELE